MYNIILNEQLFMPGRMRAENFQKVPGLPEFQPGSSIFVGINCVRTVVFAIFAAYQEKNTQ